MSFRDNYWIDIKEQEEASERRNTRPWNAPEDKTQCCKNCKNGVHLPIGVQCRVNGRVKRDPNGSEYLVDLHCYADISWCSDFNVQTKWFKWIS
jgi:hypothetical protein